MATSRRHDLLAAATVAAVVAAHYAFVAATNFGGTDEWLVLSLASNGIVDFPYTNRPFTLLWHLPAALLAPHSLPAFLVLEAVYLVLIGWTVAALCRRLAPDEPALGLMAGVFAAVWGPTDYLRLNTVLLAGAFGFTLTALMALLLLLESQRRQSAWLVAPAAALAFVAGRASEPALALLAMGVPLVAAGGRRWGQPWRRRALAWMAVLAPLCALAAWPLVSAQSNYQLSALGFDGRPDRVLARLALLFAHHLGPLLRPSGAELATLAVPLALAPFVAGLLLVPRETGGAGSNSRVLAAFVTGGLAAAALGFALFALTARIAGAARTQITSAPGVAVFLAAGIMFAARRSPPRWRPAVVLVLGGWVVAVSAARTSAMQSRWNVESAYPAQSRMLREMVRQAPRLAPGTLVVLLDDSGAWRANFTFHHAVRHLYQGAAVGLVFGSDPFLYPTRFVDQGIVTEPWPSIRSAWRSPVTLHGYDRCVVYRASAEGALRLLEEWPADTLPPLPPGARYAPRGLILPGPPSAAARLLHAASTPGAGAPGRPAMIGRLMRGNRAGRS